MIAARLSILLLSLGLALSAPALAFAAGFFDGREIRFIVGYSPGGGFDLYTRTIARHIGKHIPGNPATYVDNMPGAGSLLAANYLYNKSDPDGLTIGVWNGGHVLRQALGDPRIKFDAGRFGWIGAPTKGTPTCAVMGFTGLKTLADVLGSDKPIKMGATRPGGMLHDLPRALNKVLGTRFQVITGYKGSANILVAMRSGEIDGYCLTWQNMKTTAQPMLQAEGKDRLIPFVIHSKLDDPEIKELPLFREVIKGKESLATYEALVASNEFFYPLAAPPGTPRERLEILRMALEDTLEDPDFLLEANKAQMDIVYVSGAEVARHVAGILKISAAVKENLSFLLGGGRAKK